MVNTCLLVGYDTVYHISSISLLISISQWSTITKWNLPLTTAPPSNTSAREVSGIIAEWEKSPHSITAYVVIVFLIYICFWPVLPHTHPHSNTQTQRHAASSKTPISNNLISDAPPECDKSVSVHGADNSIHWKPAACLHYMITSPDQVLSVTDLWKLSCLSCKCASMNENRMDLNGWNLWHVLV